MKRLVYAIIAAVGISLAFSCNDGSSIGNSLSEESIIIIVDSNFTVSGRSYPIDSVQSRTLSQLIGQISAPRFGAIYSDFVGQFMPSIALDTVDIVDNDIDSVKLFMQMMRGNFVGDSLSPMGITVYRLNKDLPYPIYSDFNPDGYYDPNDILCQGVYTASTLSEADSLKGYATVVTDLFMPKQLGIELLNAYKENPNAFANPSVFTRDIFKGVYIRSTFGSGRITDFTTTSIRFYFHKSEYNSDSARYDTTAYVGDYFAITPEVVVNNNIRYTADPDLKKMVSEGQSILAAPVGYEVEMRFPAPEILNTYHTAPGNQQVLNTLSFTIPVEKIENDFDIAPPPYVLLILKSKKEEFFANNSLNDDITSFYAVYDSTNQCYTFSAMRNYLAWLLEKDSIAEEDYTFVLTPVQVNTESSASSGYYYTPSDVVSSIVPYVSKPTMAKILVDRSKIKLTFSTNNGKIY